MENLNKYREEQDTLKKKYESVASERLQQVREELESISEILGKSMAELLGVMESTEESKGGKNKPSVQDEELKAWRKENIGKTFLDSDGKNYTVGEKGRVPAKIQSAFRDGTLREAS